MFKVLLFMALASSQGEANVQREIPKAKKIFGLKRKSDYQKYYKMAQKFEQKGGFQGEAEMDAAKRILGIK